MTMHPMPGDELREAAEKLRALLSSATPGTRTLRVNPDGGHHYAEVDAPNRPRFIQIKQPYTEATRNGLVPNSVSAYGDAAYIAAMHPGVGAALADWLGCLAMLDPSEWDAETCGWCSANHPAAVARALNPVV